MTDSDTLLMARIESAIRFAPPSFTPIRGPVPTAVSAEHNASHNGPRYISPQFIPGQPFQRRKRPGPLPDFVSRDDIPQASGRRQRQPDVALAACGFFTRGRHQYAVAEREPVPKTDSAFIAILKEPSKPRPRKPEPNYDAISQGGGYWDQQWAKFNSGFEDFCDTNNLPLSADERANLHALLPGPQTHIPQGPELPKRKRGRPPTDQTTPVIDLTEPSRRGPGRPRKEATATVVDEAQPPKRGRGRPRKVQPVQAVTHVAAQPVQVAQPAAPVVAQPVQAAQTATQATTQPMAWPPWGYSGDLATGSTWGKMWLPGTSPWSSSTPSDPVMVGTKTFAEFQLEEATRLAREGVTFEDVQVAEAMQLPEGKTTRSGMEH